MKGGSKYQPLKYLRRCEQRSETLTFAEIGLLISGTYLPQRGSSVLGGTIVAKAHTTSQPGWLHLVERKQHRQECVTFRRTRSNRYTVQRVDGTVQWNAMT